MKQRLEQVRTYVGERSELFVGVGVVAVLLVAVCVIVLAIQLSGPRIVYQPAKACSLLTPEEAQQLLGEKILSTEKNEPVITGNVATSKCSYTDENVDNMKVAAVAVRTGINDEGVAQNKTDFSAKKKGMQEVQGLGESAYFDPTLGQLNILKGTNWYILSYGVGSAPEANTLDDAKKLADKVL